MSPICRSDIWQEEKVQTKATSIQPNYSGHPGYEGVTPPTECPKPSLFVDEDTPNNTDQEHNPDIENKFAGASFHFTSAHDHEPQDDTGVHKPTKKLSKPWLIVQCQHFWSVEGNIQIWENFCWRTFAPCNFHPMVKRRTHISVDECYHHYCRLSLPQFLRGDFILILNHMYNRQRNFQTAVVTCKSSVWWWRRRSCQAQNERPWPGNFSKTNQAKRNWNGREYIRAVEASCKPVGYTALSAKHDRRKHFAMDNYFKGHAIFFYDSTRWAHHQSSTHLTNSKHQISWFIIQTPTYYDYELNSDCGPHNMYYIICLPPIPVSE